MQRVLMVDDDLQVVSVLATAIEAMGHQVDVVSDTDQVETVCSSTQPDVALLDLMMPGRSGIELIQPVSEICPRAIIAIATGLADIDVARKAFKAGAWSMLYKPYSIKDLAELMELAAMISASFELDLAVAQEREGFEESWSGNESWDAGVLSSLAASARIAGASEDVARRRIPLIAVELMDNARAHGIEKDPRHSWGISLIDAGDELELNVSDSGDGFDWKRTILKLDNTGVQGRAKGLWLVRELADHLEFDRKGSTAIARIRKAGRTTCEDYRS